MVDFVALPALLHCLPKRPYIAVRRSQASLLLARLSRAAFEALKTKMLNRYLHYLCPRRSRNLAALLERDLAGAMGAPGANHTVPAA
jgi:hypothetical protein